MFKHIIRGNFTLFISLMMTILLAGSGATYAKTLSQATWVSGSDIRNQAGVYGTKGVADPMNMPGGRFAAISWTDSTDNLWLFGGYDYYLNDLWKFDGINWTWISGSDTRDEPGVYGTKWLAEPNNVPGGRGGSISWMDSNDNLWLFGGQDGNSRGYRNDLWLFGGGGCDSFGDIGFLNDLWKIEVYVVYDFAEFCSFASAWLSE